MPIVKDLMTENVITIDLHRTVFDSAILMNEKKVGCLIVMDGQVPAGIVTERDFVRRVVAKKLQLDTKISKIMSKPLITININSSLRKAARLMIKKRIRRLPAVKRKKLVGIISVADFARHLSKKSITEEVLDAMARYPTSVMGKTMNVIEEVVGRVYPE